MYLNENALHIKWYKILFIYTWTYCDRLVLADSMCNHLDVYTKSVDISVNGNVYSNATIILQNRIIYLYSKSGISNNFKRNKILYTRINL